MNLPRSLRRTLQSAWARLQRRASAGRPGVAADYSQLAILEAHFEALCRAVHHGVFLADAGGVITLANERLRKMLGVMPGTVLTTERLTEALQADDRVRVRAEWEAAIAAGEEFSSEHRVQDPKGGEAVVRVYAAPVTLPQGIVGYVGTVEDVTRLKSVEEQLLENQRHLEAITENVPAIIGYLNADMRYGYVNAAFEASYGRTRKDTLGRRMDEVMNEAEVARAREMMAVAVRDGICQGERSVRRGDTTLWLQTSIVVHRSPSGDPQGYFSLSTDITSRRVAEEALLREKERVLVTLGSISDAVATVDADGCIDYLNPAAERLTGWTLEEARGLPTETVIALQRAADAPKIHPLRAALSPDCGLGSAPIAAMIDRRTEEALPVDLSVACIHVRDGGVEGAVAVFRDATNERRQSRRLAWEATHDPLTRLRNRRGLTEALEAALGQSGSHVLLFLDLDRFKAINDNCGHAAGDEVLRMVARRLERHVRVGDVVARLGGDEFVVLAGSCTLADAHAVAEKMRVAIESLCYESGGRQHRIGVSIGLADAAADAGHTAESLLAKADTACYAAKTSGRNRVVQFVPRLVA